MKMLPIFVLAVGALLLPMRAGAATLDEAHSAFAEGKFQVSAAAYQAVMDEKGYSAPVLFDLGNSYFRQGDYPRAILAYKRALWLDPGDEDARANLQTAQKLAGSPVEEPSRLAKITGMLGANGWAWLACLDWTLLCACFLLRAVLPRQRAVFSGAGFACALVLVGAIAAMALTAGELNQAVVVDKKAVAVISPFSTAAPSSFTPVPGETVTIEQSYQDYLRITDASGHSGWIARAQVTPVVPETGSDKSG